MGNLTLPVTRSYTTAIPFDQPEIDLGEHTVTGPITFTKVTTGVQATFCTAVTLIADGTNIPDFSAFDGNTGAAANYDNTVGAVNQVVFYYLGGRYCVTVKPLSGTGGGGGDVTAPLRGTPVTENATPTKLRIPYNESLDGSSVPNLTDFILNEASPGAGFTGSVVVGSNYVELTYSTPMAFGDVWDIGYTGTAIKDLAGNSGATFSTINITNNVAGGGLASDYYIGAVTAEGVDPDYTTGREALTRALIDGLDTDGVLADLLEMKLYVHNDPGATDTEKGAACALNIKSNTHNGTFSAIGAWTFADDGVTGDIAFTARIDLGVNPSTDLLQDDCMIFAYIPVGTASGFQCIMGADDATADRRLRLLWSSGSVYGEVNAPQQDNGALALSSGLIMAYRSTSGTSKIAVDGVDVKTITQTSTGLPNAVMAANFERTDASAYNYGWGKKITITGSGKAMDSTKRTALASRIATFVAGL